MNAADMVKREFAHPETVAIVDGKGYRIINKADFDPAKHKEYKGKVYGPGEAPETKK